jgi:signal transduction histidine kinase/ActR/RegA family two-component response regulator
MKDSNNKISTLKQTIRVLEEENIQLSEQAEDTMLLGLVSESIQDLHDPIEIIDQVIERISILKDIPFITCARQDSDTIEAVATFASFSDKQHFGYPLELSSAVIEELSKRPYFINDAVNLFSKSEKTDFNPRATLIIPFSSRFIASGFFIFTTEEPETARLSGLLFLFTQVVDITISKLDNLELIKELQHLTKTLEVRVAKRTKALLRANEKLKAEISERKQSEAALKNAHDRFTNLVNGIDAHVYVCDISNYEILFMNKKMKEDFGDNIEGQSCFRALRQEEAPCPFCRNTKLIESYEQHPDNVSTWETYHWASGKWYLNRDRIIRWDDGRLVKLQVASDITSIKKAEKEKEELNKRLLEAQKMEAIGTLAGGIAHDFNNLLTGILGITSMMIEDVNQDHPHYKNLRNIEDFIENATGLTKQLLGFARKGKYETSVTDLNTIVASTAELFGRTKKEIIINSSLAPNLWPAEVDRGQIRQVLLNLYVNSWQAMPDGGELLLETRNRVIQENEAQTLQVEQGNYVAIDVSDSGVGMDPSILPHIFDPFFTTKERERGTGLGLASSHGIIRNHRGSIEVASEKGKGSTFTISIPASSKQLSESSEQSKSAESGSGTVLLIDDELIIRDVGSKMLELLGYAVEVAQNGQEGLDKYYQQPADLIILDMIMPGMSGTEVFKKLRAYDPDAKIVLSSGYSLDTQTEELMATGCRGFLQKPFTLSQLAEMLKTVLSDYLQ